MHTVGDLITKLKDGVIVGRMMVTRIETRRDYDWRNDEWVAVTRVFARDWFGHDWNDAGCVGTEQEIA
jgi:hypothetical protein